MSLMVWNDNLLTGIAIVDRQHRGLLDLINEAAPVLALSDTLESEQFQPLLERLFDYAAMHFKTEEDLMAACGVDARVLAHHHLTHQRFVKQVSAMAARLAKGDGVSAEQLLSFLSGWLVFHILGEDQTMARQLKAIELGSTPTQAYDEAEGARLIPSSRALTHALVQIYTQLHRQNHELDLHRHALQKLVQERTAELEKTTEELRQSRDAAVAGSLAKSRFLGIMSHELRTPMNAILGFSKMLSSRAMPSADLGLARKIVVASEHLLDLINGVIEYAGLEAGHGVSVAVEFDLANLLAQACDTPLVVAKEKGIALFQEIDPTLPLRLKGDAPHITTVLRHFADNAAKFTRQGSITLRASRVPAWEQDHVRVRFSITDTGIGIAEEKQSLLFEAFGQLDDRPTRAFEGMGLGLALVRQLAQLLAAEVGMSSQPGQGSCFWLELDLLLVPQEVSRVVSTPSPAKVPRKVRDCDAAIVLRQLLPLLSAYDSRSSEVFEAHSGCLGQHLGERYPKLARQVASFDYDAARETVQELLIVPPERVLQ